MEPSINSAPQPNERPENPDGFENWSMEDKQKFETEKQKLNKAGIKIEIVEAQMNLVMYDETEKTLKIRHDAGIENISNYIEDVVFKEQDSIEQSNQEPIIDDIHIEEDKDKNGDKEIQKEQDVPAVPLEIVEEIKNENKIQTPNWRESEEWKKFEEMREDLARYEAPINQFGMSSIGVELKRSEYLNYKEEIAKKIKETLTAEAGENLSPEKEAELNSKINNTIYQELLLKEHNSYKNVLQEHRSETLMDKAKETLKSALSTKVGQWYLKLPRVQRMALNFTLGTVIGVGLGAAGSVGVASYAGMRLARVGASFGGSTLGTVIGEKKKSLSLEGLDKKENEEMEALKNSNKSLEEKSKELDEIKNKYEKERNKIKLKKAAWAVGLGAGAGLLTGLTEQVIGRPNLEPPHASKSPGVPTQEQINNINAKIYAENSSDESAVSSVEKLFEDQSVLRHEVVAGDSTWKILKGTLENNEQFKGMTEAQKTYVLSTLTNRVLENPQSYGLGEDGALQIGENTDFSKLFENPKEISAIFEKAQQTITVGSAQEASIQLNNEKIAAWVDKNPNTRLTNDKVAEILNTKIEASPTLDVGQKIPEPEIVPETSPKITESINTEPKLSVADLPETKTAIQNQLEKEIEDAKQRLATLTSSERKTEQSIDYENIKRAEGGLRSFGSDTEFLKALETNFRNEIDYIYGERGLFGLKKIEGVNTKEWGFIRGLDANKVLNYFRDPENSDLSPKVLVELGQSEKHRALMEHLDGLLDSAGGGVKPFENGETMEAFIKRLGSFLMRKSR